MRKLYHKTPEKNSVFKRFKQLYHAQTSHGFVGFWLFCFQSLHEPAVLLGRQCPDLILGSRPLETAAFQTFVQQKESVAFPIQRLDPVSFSATEQKECCLEWIHLELRAYHAGQTVDSTPQICIATGNINRAATLEIIQHSFRIRRTASTIAGSAPLWMSAAIPPAWMLRAIW